MSDQAHLQATSSGWRWPVVRLVENPNGSRTARVVGAQLVDFVVHVDVEKLIQMIGRRAISSKKRISKLQVGAVVVVATNVRQVEATPEDDVLDTRRPRKVGS